MKFFDRFKKKRYAPLVSFGEMVLTPKQQEEERAFKEAIETAIDEIIKEGVEITEEELAARLNAVSKAFGFGMLPGYNERQTKRINKNVKDYSCPNCGAPLHNGKCDYCGTTI